MLQLNYKIKDAIGSIIKNNDAVVKIIKLMYENILIEFVSYTIHL